MKWPFALGHPPQATKAKQPPVGSVRYDRAGRPWAFIRGQLHVENGAGTARVKRDQFVYRNTVLGERTFTPGFRDFEGEENFDLLFDQHPHAGIFDPAEHEKNIQFLTMLVSVIYRLTNSEMPPHSYSMTMAQRIYAELFAQPKESPDVHRV